MWQPEPGWQRLPGGTSPSAYGVWLAVEGDARSSSSGCARPVDGDPPELSDWRSVAWWEREPQVALHGLVAATSGLRGPSTLRVEEDDEGITMMQERVAGDRQPGPVRGPRPGSFRADAAAGRAVAGSRPAARRLAPHRTPRRLADAGPHDPGRRRRPPVAAARACISTRWTTRRRCSSTATRRRANLRGRDGDDVVAIDWSSLGHRRRRARPRAVGAGDPRGLRAPAGGVRRRAGRPRPGARRRDRRAGHGRLHVAEPAGLGAAPGRRRARGRWRASTHTPALRRTSTRCSGRRPRSRRCWPELASRVVRARWPRRCRRPAACPPRSRRRTSAGAAPTSRGSSPRG